MLSFAKPSEYDDLEDMTARSLFPDELEAGVAILSDGFIDVIAKTPGAAQPVPKGCGRHSQAASNIPAQSKGGSSGESGTKKDPTKSAPHLDYWRRGLSVREGTNDSWQGHRCSGATTRPPLGAHCGGVSNQRTPRSVAAGY